MMMISHVNFFYCLFFFLYDLFLLGYNKIDKKQKFSAPGMVQPRNKVML